jgi:hypothetical protein
MELAISSITALVFAISCTLVVIMLWRQSCRLPVAKWPEQTQRLTRFDGPYIFLDERAEEFEQMRRIVQGEK